MKLKGGGFVDPDSGLEEKAHVLKVKDTLYSAVLGAVDIASGRNSYYKIQVIAEQNLLVQFRLEMQLSIYSPCFAVCVEQMTAS